MAKQVKKDRQAVIDSIRKQQSRSEKTRGMAIVAVSSLIAVLIVGTAAYRPVKDWYDLRQYSAKSLSEIGADADACQEVEKKKVKGTLEHVPAGTPLTYEDSPPASGQHWDQADGIERKLYTTADRPDPAMLVHNMEHGYTILWYDETVQQDAGMMDDLRGIASKLQSTTNLREKFKAVPWTSEDGEPFPDGQNVAFTHWSVGGVGATDPAEQVGVSQYCSAPSGAALEQFMEDYPYMDAPEGAAG